MRSHQSILLEHVPLQAAFLTFRHARAYLPVYGRAVFILPVLTGVANLNLLNTELHAQLYSIIASTDMSFPMTMTTKLLGPVVLYHVEHTPHARNGVTLLSRYPESIPPVRAESFETRAGMTLTYPRVTRACHECSKLHALYIKNRPWQFSQSPFRMGNRSGRYCKLNRCNLLSEKGD